MSDEMLRIVMSLLRKRYDRIAIKLQAAPQAHHNLPQAIITLNLISPGGASPSPTDNLPQAIITLNSIFPGGASPSPTDPIRRGGYHPPVILVYFGLPRASPLQVKLSVGCNFTAFQVKNYSQGESFKTKPPLCKGRCLAFTVLNARRRGCY